MFGTIKLEEEGLTPSSHNLKKKKIVHHKLLQK